MQVCKAFKDQNKNLRILKIRALLIRLNGHESVKLSMELSFKRIGELIYGYLIPTGVRMNAY